MVPIMYLMSVRWDERPPYLMLVGGDGGYVELTALDTRDVIELLRDAGKAGRCDRDEYCGSCGVSRSGVVPAVEVEHVVVGPVMSEPAG